MLFRSLPTYSGNIANIRLGTSGVLTFSDGTTMTTAASGSGGSNYSNVNVAAYLNTQGYNLYSNVNVAAYLTTGQITTSNIKLAPSGNIVFADGTVQTTAASGGSSYGNTQVAAYLPTYAGNANASNVNVSTAVATPKIQFTVGGATILEDNPLDLLISGKYQVSIKGNGTYQYTFGNDGGLTGPGGEFVYANGAIYGNIIGTGFYFSNGVPFTSSSYGNTQVAQYLPVYGGALSATTITSQNHNPSASATYNLGSGTARWNSAYLSGTLDVQNSVYFGGLGTIQAVSNLQLYSSLGVNKIGRAHV